ncbi:MAG: polyprenyl synthetase family protein [Verrucomicrobiota bacterium]|nr:polyprenyl synthetase family protein [Verrucomicrobiota bacterium]
MIPMATQTAQFAPPGNWQELCDPIQPFLDEVSGCLQEEVRSFDPQIANFIQYALGSQGKQLRPALVALGARATGGLNPKHVHAAVIIEMVHLATLVHDDVVDGAEVRRSRPTLAAHWGNKVSVLAGDCLFAEALKLAAKLPSNEVCRLVSQSAKVVCTGEIRQTLHRGNFELSRTEYLELVQMKTAELFALACELGARFAVPENPEIHQALRDYGLKLGTAYQIYDDCLDVFGEENHAGKSLGTDLITGKATLPVIIALERADEIERKAWLAMLKDGEAQAGTIREKLLGQHIPASCCEVVEDYIQQANACVVELPAVESLRGLSDCLLRQLGALTD